MLRRTCPSPCCELIFENAQDVMVQLDDNDLICNASSCFLKQTNSLLSEIRDNDFFSYFDVQRTGVVALTHGKNHVLVYHIDNIFSHDNKAVVTVREVQNASSDSKILFFSCSKKKDSFPCLDIHGQQAALLNILPDLVWFKDKKGKYLFVNKAYSILCGLTQEQMIGKSLYDLLPKSVAREYVNEDLKVIGNNEKRKMEMSLKAFGKDSIWIETIRMPFFDETGSMAGLVGLGRDITDLKISNERLQVSAQLLEGQRAVLERKNIAMNEILQHIEEEKDAIKQEIYFNVEKLLLPLVRKMKQSPAFVTQRKLSLLEQNLQQVSGSFFTAKDKGSLNLTPGEINICNMIRHGLSSKEIASELKVAYSTVETHRRNIRKKLDLSNKKVNLAVYLSNISF